ncbi:MAG: AMP-binding protein [Betaproteobacteria bacterium]|nr:AMP-binding protein [Betaproteobacteria bacterium]
MRTIRHHVDRWAARAPKRDWLIAPEAGRTLSFGQLQRESVNLCRFLAGEGLKPGDKVATYLPNGLQTAAIFLGCMYGGHVSVPLNLLAQGEQLEYVLGHSDARLVFTTGEHAEQLAARVAASGREIAIIVIDVDAPSLFFADRLPRTPVHAPAEGDAALLMYTSGTTGKPKGCVLTHRNIVSGGMFVKTAHRLTERDRVLSSLPLYHINGQIVATVGTLVQGGSVVCPHRLSVSQFWDLLAEYQCSWFNVVPTVVSYLASATSLEGRALDVSRVRFGRSASAPLAPELHRAFEKKFGISIIETFGMTETCAPCFSNPLEETKRKYGSVGRPVGNVAKAARRDGSECLPGQVGELMVKGENVMQGYYKDPEETAKALEPDGWLHTGDLGYMDEEGDYFVTGRLKELIIKGGENIAPREIDDVLYKHPAVQDAAAVGIPDRHYGQEILAGVVLKPGVQASEDELRSFCERELGRYKTPKVFRFLAELPKGPSGKVQRLKLLES